MKKQVLFGLSVLVLTACSDSSNVAQMDYSKDGKVAYGDVYVSASIGEASNLVPWLTGDASSHAIAGHFYDSLLEYDKNLNLEGALAKDWEVSEDGLSITFTLRDDVTWWDGTPFTAHDIMATFEAVTDPNTRTAYAGDYRKVTKAEAVDDHTFRVNYAEPFAPALASWTSFSVMPKHIIETEDDFNETSLKTNPMGTGPYKLLKWDQAKETQLIANKNYWKGSPNIAALRVRFIPDQDTQFLELKAGKIDTMNLKPIQYTRLTDTEAFKSRYAKYKYLGFNYTYMGFAMEHPIFKNKDVRQALSYATPREKIIKGVLMGQGQSICCPFKPGTWAYNEELAPYAYDVEKAKAMLREAGWVDSDGDGIREKTLQGETIPFSFTLVTNQGNAQRIKTAEILQQAFSQVGVDMNIRVQEWSTFIENTINKRQFEAVLLGWALSPEPDPYDIWHSSKTANQEFNFIGFNNPRADELMEKARRTYDKAERKKYLAEFQQIIHDEQPYLFLYAPETLLAIHKRIKGVEPAPAGIGHNFEDWYVPLEQQLYNASALTP